MTDRFWMHSSAGDGAFLTPLLRAEGAPTTLYTVAPEARDVLRGYVPRQTVADVPKGAVILFDDVGHGRLGSFFRGRGHPVIGGNPIDRAWEIDRLHGAKMAERAGITVPETQAFTTIRQAIRFLEGEEGEWFVKPSGNPLASCALTQSGEAAKLVRRLYAVDRKGAQDFPALVLQKAVEGLEIDCDGWFDGEAFVHPFFSTLEDKRLMDGDRGPRTGCYSADTEILTETGWRSHESLAVGERVLTLDCATGRSRYEPIQKVWRYEWKDSMIAFDGRSTDLLVTPDHGMIVRTRRTLKRVEAERLLTTRASHFTIPKTSAWEGREEREFTLPALDAPWPRPLSMKAVAKQMRAWRAAHPRPGVTPVRRYYDALAVPMDDWLAFIGLYLAEGSVAKQYGSVEIAQKEATPAISAMLDRLPFLWLREHHGWQTYDRQLAAYLRPFGK